MQGSDYDLQLVRDHETNWHGFTKFILYSGIAVSVVLVLMAAFLM
ncbi:aa3-type cytochrome c oxidase subunit IV [Thalassospira sp.]|nr:aa3-type cytochrome c oxidase subunit IV [Thalassospira sp.]MDP2696923.1 aa3-type cytochrome c oxidase subunit IV [Thalassospira sp.]